MCNEAAPRNAAWIGWSDVPPPLPQPPSGAWVDLTHVLTPELSRSAVFPAPVFRKLERIPVNPANVTEIQMVAHHGTHVDAPSHFIVGGPTADQIPLDRLHGPAVIWRIEVAALSTITADHLEAARPAAQPGDMVLIDTGWAQHINTPLYEDHPHLDEEAARWLVEHQIKLLGVDFSTPDMAGHIRPPGFNWPVHQTLLSRGILIAEHVANLSALAGQRVEAFFFGLPVEGSDGAPARAVARPIRSDSA